MERPFAPIEELDQDILRAIIDYVPLSVPYLRGASKVLKEKVDKYVGQVNNLVHKLEIVGSANEKGEIRISMSVYPEDADMFEIRLGQSCLRNNSPRERIRLDEPNGGSSTLVHRVQYSINEGAELLIVLRECMHTIKTVKVVDCGTGAYRNCVEMLLEGLKIDTLVFKTAKMSDSEDLFIHHLIDDHTVDALSLSVAENVAYDSAKILLALSSRMRTLHLTQMPVAGIEKDAKFFFGRRDFDWSPTILAMFDSDKLLDKLSIDNSAYPHLLTLESTLNLCENLPNVGKKVWFESQRDLPATESFSEKINGHYTNAGCRYLSIKHASRVNEPLGI